MTRALCLTSPLARIIRRALYSAGILALSVSAAAAAGRTPTPSPRAFEDFRAVSEPLGISNAPTTFVVELKGDPVALASANAPSPMGAAEKQNLRNQLLTRQQTLEQSITRLGGQVLARYQLAYNGIKVRIPARSQNALSTLPGVVAVHRLQVFHRDNIHGVPLVGGPLVWGGVPGLRGEGIKIADIDTGIDYTHADFGGPGTVDAYNAALATDVADPDPNLVGPNAPKVKGGTDLVGDDYNADPGSAFYQPVPHPDNNPLDCGAHGTHTAGTMAGFGVLADGSTYTGVYDSATVASNSWLVGPGVAPKADLYAVRVFGCDGSTDVVVDGIEWSVANGMDVINMSLGSPFGSADDPSAVASSNAAAAGIIVIASAGNSGQNPYMVGSPSTARGAVSVAASDPTASFPGVNLLLSTGRKVVAIDANGAPITDSPLPIKVLYGATPHTAANISVGCNPDEYTAAGVSGFLVVVKRGSCARVAKAIYGQKAGALGVLMINNAEAYPPFEGMITSNPDTGESYTVTIPFLGVPLSLNTTFVAADGGSTTLAATVVANPGYLVPASFTSGGPRTGNSGLKPEVTAPGVSIVSAGMGTGTGGLTLSGTSMAAPHTTGEAALVRQAHPNWGNSSLWRAAIVNTADPALVNGYATRVSGVGLIQAEPATRTEVVALGDAGTPELSFGFAELSGDFSMTHRVKLRNFGNSPATFTVSTANDAGSPHTVTIGGANPVTVPAHGQVLVDVHLDVAAATAGDSSAFNDVAGLVVFTPSAGNNNDVILRVPYYLVPQAISNVATDVSMYRLVHRGAATATTTNVGGAVTGYADWYAWGISDPLDPGAGEIDVRAVGAQAFPDFVVFAIKTAQRWSNPSRNEFDLYVDVDGDTVDDYVVVAADLGALTTGNYNGQTAVDVIDLRTHTGSISFLADAPMNSNTMTLPVRVSQLCHSTSPCLSASSPRLTYHVNAFGWTGYFDETTTAGFNAFTPAISTGMYDQVDPGATVSENVTYDATEAALTPPLGFMVVTHDNASGYREAQLIPVP